MIRACAAAALLVLMLAACAGLARASEPPRPVGAAACIQCHASQAQAWKQSHHWHAMRPATQAGAVLAPFGGEMFRAAGVTSTFRRDDKGRFIVRTDGADGKLHDFEVTQVLGISPLQQYLVPQRDGSLHALDLAWDARPRSVGGQRWMQLPNSASPSAPREQWHWTGQRMNANFMCIECHVTGFQKRFDASARRYASRWSEDKVSCEACHGAGSRHVDWARGIRNGLSKDDELRKGLLLAFDERRNARWAIDPATGNAHRTGPAIAKDKEVDVCARCHSHRSRLSDDAGPQAPLMDAFAPSVVEPGLYWPDGQMRAEVYNYGSFLQSRMHGQGVSCSDCHDPHTGKTRLPGNTLCFQCHAAAKYEAPTHHFHPLRSAGTQCVGCHMPTTTYMSVDPRHDHFIRVPQPEQSQAVGSPDACTQCHRDKPRSWAIKWTRRWYPHLNERRSPLAAALSGLARDDAETVKRLAELMLDREQLPMARASALQALPADAGRSWWSRAARGLSDENPLVRRAAVTALRAADADQQVRWLSPMLDDPVRAIRLDTARVLAPFRTRVPNRPQLDRALSDYEASQRYNADLPESYENLGTLWMDLGEWASAEAALKQARQLAPWSASALLNLADLYRATGREAACQDTLHQVLKSYPTNAPAHHALGLSLLRQKQLAAGLHELRKAADLDPGNGRFAFVYGVALDKAGRGAESIQVLQAAADRHPRDPELAATLLSVVRREGGAMAAQRASLPGQRASASH